MADVISAVQIVALLNICKWSSREKTGTVYEKEVETGR
jgi:hypothetical protein